MPIPSEPVTDLMERLREDLVTARMVRDASAVRVLRTLMAAVDNAGAIPPRAECASVDRHDFEAGTAEAQRRALTSGDLEAILATEIADRESAAAQYEQIGQGNRAAELRAEIALLRRYDGSWA